MNVDYVGIMHVVVLLIVLVSAYLAIKLKNLLSAVLALAVMSLLLSLEFYLLHAPDVAIAEAGIGAGLTTAIYVLAIRATRHLEGGA
ncbi:MAG: hydrogenase [Thermoplasmata archaeon]|nr:MAG: hydrogenase [Thermoplasmata archaeon]